MWKPIPKFDKYEINELGYVRNKQSGKFLTPRQNADGYLVFNLQTNDNQSTTKGMHRLLMETFCPIEGMETLTVNHINHIKDDNRLENLEWMTIVENTKEAYAAGLHIGRHKGGNNRRAVRCIETGEIFESGAKAVKALSLTSRGKVGEACHNHQKTCGGYHWQWADEAPITIEEILHQSGKAIQCLETGKIFKDLAKASESMGVSHNAISKVLDNPNRTSCGYHWVRF